MNGGNYMEVRLNKNKYKRISIQCILHENCNLNCNFCFEKIKNKVIDFDYIRNLPNEIMTKIINPVMNDKESNDIEKIVEIDIMGGELFQDNFIDEIFDLYKEFVTNLNSLISNDINVSYTFYSNGIFTNYERVKKLLKETNTSLILSYDPIDRFISDEEKKKWFNTFNYFKNNIEIDTSISIILNKRNILNYLKTDMFFFLYIGTDIFIDNIEYSSLNENDDNILNDDLLYDFYKRCIDLKLFNLSHIQEIFENEETCYPGHAYSISKNLYKNKSYINECLEESNCNLIETELLLKDNISKIKSLSYNVRGCYQCKYFNKCPKMCLKTIMNKNYIKTICPIKKIYNYLEKNSNLIDNYKRWKEENING